MKINILLTLFLLGLLTACGDDEIKGADSGTDTETEEARPSNVVDGINYDSSDQTTVTLSLLAPGKDSVYVLGDFNDWQIDTTYKMKNDGEHFWLKISGLTPQKEYVFQYLVDGDIRVGDPFCDKVSDSEDASIDESIYPNLISYPSGAGGRASVLQTGQTGYQWQNTSYSLPEKQALVIYELLIRDFTDEGTYKAVIDKLGYLKELGINAVELMPFSEFEGNSSWGYNPNYYFAPDKAYGTKDDLKELIDSCHGRDLLVIQDIVLNHAYGSCPLVKMYWDKTNERPASDNPWFNTTSPNTLYSYGYDFNHESTYTQNFVDSVTTYWLSQYHIDGFRFDFTKGFTNTVGDGYDYDASRIAILERIANHVWNINKNAYVILEHFTENSEEKELTSYSNGMLVWGNGNYNFNEATMGYNQDDNSDFSWTSWQTRGFTQPGLVAYMESHDEERLMYKNISYGNSSGSYNIQDQSTALKRNEMAAAFFFCLTGPKMIWQFGEFGYDISIDYNGRTGEKPLEWDYLNDADHLSLFKVYAAMINLRKLFPVFDSGTETLSLSGDLKYIQLELDDHHITLVGNFGVSTETISAPFQHTGTWYEFFSNTTLDVTSPSQSLSLEPGEYRLYSDKELPEFNE